MANLNPEQIRRLARLGAVARLQQLREEEAAIQEEFPELFGRGMQNPTRRGRKRAEAADAGTEPSGGDGAAPRRRRRRGMSPAARKAVSLRMRKYWAERRKAKGVK